MREFDKLCLTPVASLSPDEIKEIRLNSRVSQSVFAHYLNVSPGVVSQWEHGEKRPAGASLKLLVIVRNKGLEAIA
jgi:putative transcriptional regulator